MNAITIRNEQSKKLVAFFGSEESLVEWENTYNDSRHTNRFNKDWESAEFKETAFKFLKQFPEIHDEFLEYYKNDLNIDLSNNGHLKRVLSFYDDNGIL